MTQRRMFVVAGKVAGRMLHRYWKGWVKGVKKVGKRSKRYRGHLKRFLIFADLDNGDKRPVWNEIGVFLLFESTKLLRGICELNTPVVCTQR